MMVFAISVIVVMVMVMVIAVRVIVIMVMIAFLTADKADGERGENDGKELGCVIHKSMDRISWAGSYPFQTPLSGGEFRFSTTANHYRIVWMV